MKKETTQKKTWQKPEVQDLDVKNTAAKWYPYTYEDMPPLYTVYPSGS